MTAGASGAPNRSLQQLSSLQTEKVTLRGGVHRGHHGEAQLVPERGGRIVRMFEHALDERTVDLQFVQ